MMSCTQFRIWSSFGRTIKLAIYLRHNHIVRFIARQNCADIERCRREGVMRLVGRNLAALRN